MLLITCPYCGPRPELEFTYGGQAHLVRPVQPTDLTDEQWAGFLYMRTNTKGVYAERWRHLRGCARYFNALRDTSNDRILAVYRVGEAAPPSAPSAPSAPGAPGAPSAPSAVAGSGVSDAPR